ncbi:hypothetical protein [Paenarthrobacter aurescens]|uniref:DUF1508 domain-containing protein n=1 Tax=Paenarthrobacter aurescens TaxID=43663 RepID=A0A4Y3NDA8_PAEAU|nr:hypothetical protein [Paenarthrobacter aurescens]MDO6145490.1 hypothetical protein [Paenarthrobacter aurescens]MDO6149299.1 hypothetical protein [Paenarthrobacter aurescens]MDO6160539.1 hypothetical protein [Paenarthrobacter aurescens]MDO6164398.1 hypothetical protein [Paenarthrobacter aurescens]GEB19934.1 hypothetical protein AAU01_26890 [Paenarthrobacter aurescens]
MLFGIEDEEVRMAGHLELVETPDGEFRILMVDGDDVLMGLSKQFSTMDEAVEGVAAIREVAGTGLLRPASAERYAVLMLEEPVIDSALAAQGAQAQSRAQAQTQAEVVNCGG